MSEAAGLLPEDIASDKTDTIVRTLWLAGRPCGEIRNELGGVGIGMVGHLVQALGLPVRDHHLKILDQPVGVGPVHPVHAFRRDGEA